MLAFVVIGIIIAFIVYQMTRDAILTGVVGVILVGVTVVLYFVKSSLFEGAIQKVLDLSGDRKSF